MFVKIKQRNYLYVFIAILFFLQIFNFNSALSYSFDTLSYKLYIDSLKYYYNKQPEKAVKLGKELLLFLENKKNEDDLEKIYEGLSLASYYCNNRNEALTYLKLQINILQKKKNYYKLSKSYNRIGALFHEWSLLTEALSYYNKALEYALKSDSSSVLAQTYNNFGLINKDQGNFDKAFEYFIKAKEIYQQRNDLRNLSYTLNNIGIVYKNIKSYEKAIRYYQESLEIKKKLGDVRAIANSYGNIAEVYLLMKNYKKAEQFFNDALILHTQANDKENIIKDIIALAKVSCFTEQLDKAENHLRNAEQLINEATSKDINRYFIEVKALLYEKRKKYKEALELYKYLKEFNDSIYTEKLLQKSLDLEHLINKSFKEQEISELRLEHQQALERLRKNLTFKYFLIIALVILFFLLIIVFVRLKFEQKSKMAIEEKNIQIEKINEELITTNEELENKVKERTNYLLKEINDKEELIKQLEEAIKKLEESNYLKDAFFANINYEIRTPLSSIMGLSEILKSKINAKENSELVKYVDGIVQSSSRLLNLLNNIIDISRAEANDIKPHLEVCNPNKLVKKVGDLFIFRINEKKLELEYSLGEVPHIRCDKDLLFKVLVEILDNAVKYTMKGKITVSTNYILPSEEVKISISDTGVGIEEAYLSGIFDTFIQENMKYNRPYQGSGIGLPLAKRLVKLMGGTIEISTKKGYGTTVNIVLPSTHEQIKPEIDDKKIEVLMNEQKGKVLLVEDDDFNALFLTTILEPIAKVTLAKTGAETLKIIEENLDSPFDLVILDINLPQEWQGNTLLKMIKENYNQYLHVPFIAQTAYSMPSDRERIIEEGFVEYFSKPINTEHFLNTVKLMLIKK